MQAEHEQQRADDEAERVQRDERQRRPERRDDHGQSQHGRGDAHQRRAPAARQPGGKHDGQGFDHLDGAGQERRRTRKTALMPERLPGAAVSEAAGGLAVAVGPRQEPADESRATSCACRLPARARGREPCSSYIRKALPYIRRMVAWLGSSATPARSSRTVGVRRCLQ